VVGIRRLGVALFKNGLLVLALCATTALSALVTMRVALSSRAVLVPSLVGRRVTDAGALLGQQGLQLRVEGKRHDPRVPRGRIAVQEPRAGAILKANRSVRTWLSLGPERLEVPLVEGESVRTARLMLNQAQVPLGRIVEAGSMAPEGTILLQRPPAGETDDVEGGVSLLVSCGPQRYQYLMPDLIGRRAAPAIASLERAGWKPSVRQRSYPGVAAGIILRQQPPAGHPVMLRDSVALEINQP
jgi:serine/threonine-protein kinase